MSLTHHSCGALAFATAAALRTRLLGELLHKPGTARELAGRLGLDVRATGLVLELLATTAIVHREDDQFAAGNALRELASSPGGDGLVLGMWGHVEEFLRTGEPFTAMDLGLDEREQAYQNVVGSLGDLFADPARQMAEQLSVRPQTILDVGCGSGVWSLAIAERHVDARTTGLDLPAVLASFRARAASLSMTDRTHTIAGDMHAVELPPRAFDLVVVANVLRLETPERAESLLQRLAACVAPGGALLVIDSIAEGTPERERARAAYALHHGLRMRTGHVHRAATMSRWLAATVLSRITTIDIAGGVGGLGGLLATHEAA